MKKSIQTGPLVDGSFVELKKTTASSDYQQFAFIMVGKDSVKLYNRKIDKVLEGVAGENPTDVSFLSKGIYILNVTQGEQVKTLKVLIN